MARRTKLDWTIVSGCLAFIFVLFLSAAWEADIRWLHFFQALMYVAVIVLSMRHNRWGYFIGVAVAGFWNYTNFFVTTFFRAGRRQLALLLTTGHVRRPDLLIAVFAVLAHFVIIAGCLWAYARLRDKSWTDALRFLVSFAVSTAYFAAVIALCQPRYLPLFERALHPHWNL